jgi:anti-sigma regulatory factor (Ser/Thr protein kinase)
LRVTRTLALSGDFANPELDLLCDELGCLQEWVPEEPGYVDLADLGALGPSALAVLLTSLRGLQRRQICNPVKDIEPPRTGPLAGLSQEQLAEVIGGSVGHWQETSRGTVLGSELFSRVEEIDRATKQLSSSLISHTQLSAHSITCLCTMVFELAENVLQHSDTACGAMCAQIRAEQEHIGLAIADSGIGIRASLAANPDFSDIPDDLTAISTAVSAGATGEPGTGGGMGLFLARCLVRGNNGLFLVRSGDAAREETNQERAQKNLPPLQGTLVAVEINCDRRLDYEEVEERLSASRRISG